MGRLELDDVNFSIIFLIILFVLYIKLNSTES